MGARTLLAGAAAMAVSAAAQAATFPASDEATLNGAIALANVSPDQSSTIDLANNVSITALGPVLAKNIGIVPNGFGITASGAQVFGIASGGSLTFQGALDASKASSLSTSGGGTLVFAGAGSTIGGALNIDSGTSVRVEGGGSLTANGSANVTGDNSKLIVTGTGSQLIRTGAAIIIESAAGSTVEVLAGGAIVPGTLNGNMSLGNTAGTSGTLVAQGIGSKVSTTNLSGQAGQATIRVLDGAVVSVGSTVSLGGSGASSSTGVSNVAVSGTGSALNTLIYQQHRGTLEVFNGGLVRSKVINLGASGNFDGLVAGAGSSLTSFQTQIFLGQGGQAKLTVADGGAVSANNGTVALNLARDAGSSAILNIGAAVGDAAVAPGNIIASTIVGGAGTAVVNFNHNATDYDFATPISGSTSVNHTGGGTTTLTGANTYAGPTNVAAGTLRAGAASVLSSVSAHTVASGATLDLAGFEQTLSSLNNAGTVSLPGSAAGNTLTVTGAYVGNGGTLRLGTALGDSSSASDRLVLSGAGASASGKTQIQVTNLGGLGALTTGNGIEVITATGGATTTAQSTKDAFALTGGHVDAGAYEYRLYAADATGAGENWYLRSTAAPVVVPVKPGPAEEAGATPGPVPLYRAEVPMYAVVPEQFREFDFAMLGNLHQRVGDERVAGTGTAWGNRQGWGRIISMDRDIAQQGTVSPSSSGRLNGFQAGTDLWANPNWRTGLYAGQLEGDMDVNGFARGVVNYAAGRNDLRSQYLGAYATWSQPSGTYVDTVLQAGRHDYTAYPSQGQASSGKGDSVTASVEVGQGFAIAPRWTLEPQLQLAYQHLSLDDTSISGASIQQNIDNGWIARVGLRIKGAFDAGPGTLQPYARVNFYKRSSGTDITRFIGPAGSTDITSQTGGTSSELALGATWQLGNSTSLYGELGKLWDIGGDARTSSGVSGSVGVKVLW